MKNLISLFLMLLSFRILSQEFMYAVASEPTPVLNTPNFRDIFGGDDGKSVKTDKEGLIRELEFIAFPGTVFELLGEYDYGSYKIFKVITDEYPYDVDLYIDSRFVELKKEKPPSREIRLPSLKNIYEFLDIVTGNPYCWGGNYNKGISKLIELYALSDNLSQYQKQLWRLEGCDCSGLMYEATNGYTPRNTSKMVYFGEGVDIEGLTAAEIKDRLKPLDMIVWSGHVIYVYDQNTAIQSSLSLGGVVKTDLLETLKDVMKTYRPVNDYSSSKGKRFVVRRWYK
ncbi:MAG: peptidoglycan endopeptidase [Ignavibacteria bacterium]|nr:peptidoglycan endopeptidase [Ignavibacteria bacterium]